MIDLHCHSYFSDGELSPTELIDLATSQQIQVLALTDHDTVSGLSEAIHAAKEKPITFLPGIEISVKWKKQAIHIIGLGIDSTNDRLLKLIDFQEEKRAARAQEIAIKLEACGIFATLETIKEHCPSNSMITRAHFAKLLVEWGKVKDFKQAFTRYLGRGKPAFVATSWVEMEEAIDVIHASSGLAILAHPLRYGLTQTKLRNLIEAFVSYQGVAMEVISGQISAKEVAIAAGLCHKYELLASVGSDFHGFALGHAQLGVKQALPEICTPVWTDLIKK